MLADHCETLERVHEALRAHARSAAQRGPHGDRPPPSTAGYSARLRAVLAEFVRHDWLAEGEAVGMLDWSQSGFGAYVRPPLEERAGLRRVVRYSARAPPRSGFPWREAR